ncbi:MAG: molybdopterin molybdotransferase MoeA, partial [Candidatus Aureabacteria bacterium]|nr:molybdopterin molybdotransferase MoeA [Candidatus Auribacterota bacterium]
MLTIPQALALILKAIRALQPVRLPLADCLDRVLAEDIAARGDIPPFPNSAMDGFAVRARDTRGAKPARPAILAVIEDLPAGRVSRRAIREGEAIRIMTGAPLPEGADAVVRVEDTAAAGRRRVKILAPAGSGLNLRKAGESVRKGETVLRRGKVIRPQEIGMLASLGLPQVKVIPRPTVAIISTGNELQEIDKNLSPGKIFKNL